MEARGPAGALFGEERLREGLARGGPAAGVKARLLADLRRHRAGAPLYDDVTFVIVESMADPEGGAAPASGVSVG